VSNDGSLGHTLDLGGFNAAKFHLMRLSFIGITPDTPDNGCPAVYVDEDTGDIWIQGETVTHPGALAEVGRHSPIGPGRGRGQGTAGHEAIRGPGPHPRCS
jgi:hypothetical protein